MPHPELLPGSRIGERIGERAGDEEPVADDHSDELGCGIPDWSQAALLRKPAAEKKLPREAIRRLREAFSWERAAVAHCSICLARKPAAVSTILLSMSPIDTPSSLLSSSTVPIGSPPATIGAIAMEENVSAPSRRIS